MVLVMAPLLMAVLVQVPLLVSLLGSFDSSEGNLGSGLSPCKVAFSQCGVDPLPTWSSLQTHSFTSWCSSLFRKALRSGTAFGAFLLKTSHVVRGGCPASAKAIFPLPVPNVQEAQTAS